MDKEKLNIARTIQWQKGHPWWRSYSLARYRCLHGKYKGRVNFNMTMKDFETLWQRDKAYLQKQPSIDRIDNSGHYIKENCRFIEKSLNTALGHVYQKKSIKQFSLDGRFLKLWIGAVDASMALGLNIGNLSSCLHGKRYKTGGYRWEFAEKN